MEVDVITLSKTLYYLIERFISSIKTCFDPEVLDVKKVFQEIVKRSEVITQDLRIIATSALATLETSDVLDIKDQLDKKIEDLTQKLLQQDFVELLNGNEEPLMISEGDLCMFLLAGAMTDITDFTPSSLKLGRSFGFHIPLSAAVGTEDPILEPPGNINFNCLLSSSQFENANMQFEDELSEMRRISARGFSASDLDMFNVATILKYENSNMMKNSDPNLLDNSLIRADYLESPTSCVEFDLAVLEDIDSQDSDSFRSWEGCLGKFLPDHFYISEVTPEVALLNISEKESQIYYSLLNPSAAVLEKDMVHDVLDMLIGIPSNTFFYDIHARKFRMRSGVHLPNLSPECTARVVSKFIESGGVYYLLHVFSQNFVSAHEGFVFKGFQLGIQQVLTMYKELIIAVKVRSPSMLYMRTDVLKNAEMLQTFGAVCGIDTTKMIFNEIPKGLGLLSYLHDVARSHKRKETGIMIAVLLKYTYAPYFSFLNKWMTEGICDDLYGEFQIIEDFNYLQRRDVMYWNFAYTENIDDPTRVVPSEIKSYSQGILDCGKSIALLKICCPDIFSLKYLFYKPPPALSMLYSFSAAVSKFEECEKYISLKEKAEEIYGTESTKLSVDRFYTKYQKFVDREAMMNLVQRRWDILCAARKANSNIFSFSQIKRHHLNDHDSPIHVARNLKDSIKKWSSLHDLRTEIKDCDFNGQLYGNIGLMFSSCGYLETELKCGNEEKFHFTPTNFSRQLDLISYTQDFAVNSLKSMSLKYKEMFSISEMEFLNSVQIGDFSTCRSSKTRSIDNVSSLKCKDFSELSSNHLKSENTEGQKSKSALNNNQNNCVRLNSFVKKLASLLVSEYGDSVNDIYSCIQVTSLQRLMMHNFNAVLKMRIRLVERTIMKYIVTQLGLDSLLLCLRNIYFLQDETFSQSLCDQLFTLVQKCRTPREFANWAVLSKILQNAISDSHQENNPLLASVNANIISLPEEMPAERTEFLRLFQIEFEVQWPLNIIVHQACIQQYLKIFTNLLEIEFLCWLLGRSWRILVMTCKELHLDDAPQFREIMLNRFVMEQFIRVIRNSIHQHLQGPLWEFLQKSFSVEESSIDSLQSIHLQYLEKASARCFLTDETHVLHELIFVMFHQIYKFCTAVFECSWEENDNTGHYETFVFKRLSSSFDTFKQYQKVFLKRIMKEALTKRFGRHWDKEYQEFLETIHGTDRNIT